MEKKAKIYEGKAKILYETEDPGLLIQYFKDDATAFNAQKRGTIKDKGILNNRISSRLFTLMEGEGIKTHFVRQLNDREMLVCRLRMIPVEVVVRNTVAGSLAQRFGLEEGATLAFPIVEYYYKRDDLNDPMLNEDHIRVLDLASVEEMSAIKRVALRVNEILLAFLDQRRLRLIDFKLEFGYEGGEIRLGDEITPDGCRFWDKLTNEKMDKDRFRRDLGKVEETYQEVFHRICS